MFLLWLVKESFLCLLLSPIRLLVTILIRLLWKPIFEFNSQLLNSIPIANKNFNFDPENFVKHSPGDQAKFIGMYVGAYPTEQGKRILLSYIKDGYFDRKIYSYYPKPFSGDMLSGWLYGVVNLYKKGLLTEEDINKICKAIEKALFERPYCQFYAPWNKKKDRGFLFRFWFLGHDFVPPLALLTVILKIRPSLKLRLLYYWLRILSFPFVDLTPEGSVQYGKLFWISWYAAHSRAVLAKAVLTVDPGNKLFEGILRFTYQKHKFYNPDIVALYCDYFGWNKDDEEFVKRWLDDYEIPDKPEQIPEEYLIRLVHLKGLKKILVSRYILPSRYRINEYRWEKSPVERRFWNSSPIDYYHLLALWNRRGT